MGKDIRPCREEEKHSKISVWFTDKGKKIHCEKRHGIDVRVANRVHLKELPHSNLSSPPSLIHDTGHTRTRQSLPHCAGPSSMPLWCSLVRDCPRPSQPCTPQDIVQHLPLLSIALVCCSKGRFTEIGHKGVVSVSKREKRTRDKCIICSIPVQLLL